MTKLLFAFFLFAFTSTPLLSAPNTSQVNVLNYATTNVTSAAYVVLIASTSTSTRGLEICDTSGQLVKFAIGATGSETDIVSNQPSSCKFLVYYVPQGTQISVKAIATSATTGYSVVSLIP